MKSQNIIYCLVLCVFISVATASCSTNPQVTRVSADTQTDLTGRWNDTDVRYVCEALIDSAIHFPPIDTYIRNYSTRNNGALPMVIVGSFKNATSEHTVDTSIIANYMRAAIIKSGKLAFVESGNTRDEIRAERWDQMTNASDATAAAQAQETGAHFMLTGEVSSMEERLDNTTVRSYFVKATMTNIETNVIIWEDMNSDIKKVIRQPKVKP